MKNKTKKYLKTLDKYQIKELVHHPDLTEDESWLIYYTYGERRMIVNICYKLNMSESRYNKIRDEALIKLYYILNL